MEIKLCTNTIPSGKKVSFNDLVNKYAAKKESLTKTASKKEKDEAEGSGQPEWEGKAENNNDPEVDEKACMAKAEESVKKAGKNEDEKGESSGQLDVEPLHQTGESVDAGNKDLTDDKVKKTEIGKSKKAAGIDNFGDKKAKPFGAKEEKEDDKEEKEAVASTNGRFIRVAKLNDKTKSWLKKYWQNLYPAEYVDAMIAD